MHPVLLCYRPSEWVNRILDKGISAAVHSDESADHSLNTHDTCWVYHTKVLLYKGIIVKGIIHTKVLLNKGIIRN